MKILTWNILASEWIEPEYYPTVKDFSIMDSEKRISLVMKKLNVEQADIILLQEVMDTEYDVLYKHYRKSYFISSLFPIQWGKTKSSSGNITMVRKTLCKKIEESTIDFGVVVKTDQFAIYNVHLDDVSKSKRIKQMEQIKPEMNKEKCVILGGDFNQEYSKSCPIYQLPKFNIHNHCITYFVEKNMNIDNILTKGFVVSNDKCSFVPGTVSEGLKHYGSDHIPVIAYVY